ncbi:MULTISPECIES: hypothetical protein [unclassified Ralstonia]|uniref:hypothetical protein n=1 Tax=unclassified Ralstonia TaxID=209769 RepID=UPI0012DDA9CE|nr:hypothetical protein [Ralstonia sp. UNC404CL21Col]
MTIGAILGLAVSLAMQARWTAKMTVQIGQISTWDPKGISSRMIENQLTASDRYNLPSSRLSVLRALGLPGPDAGNRTANLVFDSLHATAAKSPDLVNVQVSAYSREAASAVLAAAMKAFSAEHQKQYELAVSGMKRDLQETEVKLVAAEREYQLATQALKTGIAAGAAASDQTRNVLVTNMATLINAQILELRQSLRGYREALEPLRTYPTRMVGDIYAPISPSTPGRLTLTAIGAVLGMFAAMACALLRTSNSITV